MFQNDSAIGRVLNLLTEILYVGILWVVTSLPIVTAGTAAVAAYYAMSKSVRHKTGYISKNYTQLGAKGETTANVNLRSGAGANTPSLGVVYKGTSVTLLGVSGSWTEVSVNGNTGFIYTKYVK